MLDRKKARKAAFADVDGPTWPTDAVTTMAEVMECKDIITYQRDLCDKCIKENGAIHRARVIESRAQLDMELQAIMLDAHVIVAKIRLAKFRE